MPNSNHSNSDDDGSDEEVMEDVEQVTEQRMEQDDGPPSDLDPALCPHGQFWTVIDQISLDAVSQSLHLRPSFLSPDAFKQLTKDVKDYFFLMYPMQIVSQTLDFTNAQLMYQQHRALSKGE